MSVNLLARIPFFTGLPPGELDRLMKELDVVNLNSGDILFHEGDPGEHLYVVVEGELEILLAPDTDDELILNLLHAGEYLGEMSLLQPGGLRTASARARGQVVLLSMNREQ
ncbi:MAG TPA: cyclic nucleotide-binding domain-containing protein, partial [Anaerolineales bacterium]